MWLMSLVNDTRVRSSLNVVVQHIEDLLKAIYVVIES